MKTPLLLPLLALMLLPGLVACAPGDLQVTAKVNSPYIHADGGTMYLQLTVQAPKLHRTDRQPLNLAVVLDRSGSMADQGKMENAKKALLALIDQLDERDILSIVIYDDVIDVLRPASRVGSKERIRSLVREIQPRNSTNLGGGMCEGFHQVQQNLDHEYVNRVVLLSDGLANTGITDPNELGRIARRYRHSGISLTTMGVGLEYNENMMVSLSENGGGNYYFIESPHALAHIMQKELNLLSSVCVRNAVLELSLGRGVRIKDVIGYDWNSDNGSCRVPLGEMYSGETRDLTLELTVPPGGGSLTIAEGKLCHDDAKGVAQMSASFASKVQYSEDVRVIEQERDLQVQAKTDVAVSTRAVNQATKAMDEGHAAEAAQILTSATNALKASPACAASGAGGALMQKQAGQLQDYKDMLGREDANKAKKEIQYRNYKTQKSKEE